MTAAYSVIGDYFKAGGTLRADAPTYVVRPADEMLLRQVLAGQLCYVLTTRQMGKSSLMIRTAASLREQGVAVAVVDISSLGAQATASQWYLGIVTQLVGDLRLAVDAGAWWKAQEARGVVQRFLDFIGEVVLEQAAGPVVLFFDEIDSTLSLAFTDDFFAALRSLYNERAINPRYDRLTVVLLGVAAPTNLIKDRNRTPFNVGTPVDLKEFSRSDAQPLEVGLERSFPGRGAALLDRVFYWTNGHPYLTQRLCSAIAAGGAHGGPGQEGDAPLVDRHVQRLFLDKGVAVDENLQFVRSRVAANMDRRSLLALYRRVYRGEVVAEDERSPQQNELKLIGLMTSQGGALRVRNEIYRRVFDLEWVRENTPVNWAPYVTAGAVAVILLAVVALVLYLRWQEDKQIADLRDQFDRSPVAQIRMFNLADLCRVRAEAGHEAFFALPPREQTALFDGVNGRVVGDRLGAVTACLWPAVQGQAPDRRPVLSEVMCKAVKKQCEELGIQSVTNSDGRCACATPQESK